MKFEMTALLLCVVMASTAEGRQGQAGQWKTYTDMKGVRAVAFASGHLYAATSGGMFMFDDATGTYTKWTNSENLSSNDLTALMVDTPGRLWVGSSTGTIDVYSPSANSWQSIEDIAGSTRPQKSIHQFLDRGDSVYVVTDFGVSVFKVSRWEFGDTYASFGFTVQPSVTSTAIFGGQIYIGTDQGLAVGSLSSPNLSSPSSWTTFGGLPGGGVTALAVCNDTLLVGTNSGVFFFTGSSFQQVGSSAGQNVVAIVTVPNGYEYVWNSGNSCTVGFSGGVSTAPTVVASNNALAATSLSLVTATSQVCVGTDQGVLVWNGSTWSTRLPNGPQSNLFISLVVDEKGQLWACSGLDGHGTGFYRFDPSLPEGNRWKNFTANQYPALSTNDYYLASLGAQGRLWMSSWGRGVAEVAGDTVRRRLTSTTQPSLSATVPTDPLWVVIGSAAVDPEGNTWVTNLTAVNGNYLAELVDDTTFKYADPTIPCAGDFIAMAVDQNGTKWMTNSVATKQNSTGLYYYNEALTVNGTQNTGGWGQLGVPDGLPNGIVLSLAVDQDNTVWVGTELGVTIITNPLDPAHSLFSSFPLREQSIQTIAVDGLNDKWVGTKQGVFVVNSDGTQLLNQYTVLNTGGKLVDDDVRAIAIDQRRGIAYIGTQNGLSSLTIPAVGPQQAYTKLGFGPNPFTIPNPQPLMISNLVANSTIKILSVNGTVVNEFAAQGGGRAFWDGRDRRGNLVPTGIYFVVSYADNGNQVSNGKVAVVRK